MKSQMGRLVATGLVWAAGTLSAVAQEASRQRLITVSGQGWISIIPDEVVVALGVESFHLELHTAKSDNDARMKRLLELAPKFDIAGRQVRVDPIRVQPAYVDRENRKELTGFFVRRSLELTLTDLSRFEALMSGVIEAGANHIQGVNFRTRQAESLQHDARQMAVKDAMAKAQVLAGLTGVKAGRVHTIGEAQFGSYCSYNSGWGYLSWSVGDSPTRKIVGGDEEDPRIGRVEITASVTISVELE